MGGRTSLTLPNDAKRATPCCLSDTIFRTFFLNNLAFCLCCTAPRVSRTHIGASQEFSSNSWVYSLTVNCVSGGLDNSKSIGQTASSPKRERSFSCRLVDPKRERSFSCRLVDSCVVHKLYVWED